MTITLINDPKSIGPEFIPRRLAIVAPAYNEEESIADFVREWNPIAHQCEGAVIVINDGSKDKMLEKLRSLLRETSCDRLIVLDKPNSGHGSSCLQGYWWAVEQKFEWIFQTDSDRQTRPADFPPLWEEKNKFDFLFGNRTTRGDGADRWLVSRVLRLVILMIFQTYVVDANVPFRLMKTSSLVPLLEKVPSNIFLINSFLSIMIAKRFPIRWFDIHFLPREKGENSIDFWKISKLAIRIIKEFYQLTKRC